MKLSKRQWFRLFYIPIGLAVVGGGIDLWVLGGEALAGGFLLGLFAGGYIIADIIRDGIKAKRAAQQPDQHNPADQSLSLAE